MGSKKKTKSLSKVKSHRKIDSQLLEQWPSRPTSALLPVGSKTTKIIVLKGEVVERVYTTPKGEIVSLFPKLHLEKVA